jgi:UMF1 family MFS transporter
MNRKQVGAWALFDFANSVYPAVITTVVFQYYFIHAVVGNDELQGDWYWGRAVSLSALIVALSSPLLGAIADRAGVRKKFLLLYVAICVMGVASFTTIEPGMVWQAFVLFVIANVGFEGAMVFYNAYLPDIAPPEKQGGVSGLGFGVGYLGSAIGILLSIPFVRAGNMNAVWLMVVAFFVIFSMPSFLILPKDEPGSMTVAGAAKWGITSFRQILDEVLQERELRRFLLAFFFYIDGVLTAIVMAMTLATTTFGLSQTEGTILFLILQFSALIGAFALAKPTDRYGPKKILTGVLVLWIVAALSIYFVTSKEAFYVLAMGAGLGLGSAQAASRAFMASLTPDGKEAEMFGFYSLCGRSSSVIGPMLFGYVAVVTGNQRFAVMAISILFITGMLLLQRVKDPKAATA